MTGDAKTRDAPTDSVSGSESTNGPSSASAPRKPRRGWLYVYTSLVQLFWAFAVYVFSAGPLYWVIFEAYTFGDHPFLQQLYRPLVWLAENWPAFGRWLDWWIGLWIL